MTILIARHVSRSYGTKTVLKDVELSVEEGERVGFVGRNGSGKSTLAKILAGEVEADGGEVIARNGLRVGYLSQEPHFDPGVTAQAAVVEGCPGWVEAMGRYDAATQSLTEGVGDLNALVEEQTAAAADVEHAGGWELGHQADAMLDQLAITQRDSPVSAMSGGERRRVALARLFVANPDLAIVDEPTNHLDLETVAWLEKYLIEKFTGALILVTHDRYLLDNVVTKTVEIDQGCAHAYDGGWSQYLVAREQRQAHQDRVESNRQNFLRRELEWLRRSPQARSTKQKARVSRAEEALGVTGPKAERDATISVVHTREGRTILEAEDVAVEIGGQRLLDGVTLRLSKGERLGIIGPNGCGKTTLLRVLTGDLEPAAGKVTRGKNTEVAFLSQTRDDLVDSDSIFDNVAEGGSQIVLGKQELDVRSYLEMFLFSSTEQRQKVGTLSGGERARVCLAKTLRRGANLVVLDEPTNDLDVSTLAALEHALLEYPGSVLVVTHDRWFLDRIATGLLVFDDGRLVRHAGGYSDLMARRARGQTGPTDKKAGKRGGGSSKKAKAAKLTLGERLELEKILQRIDEAEAQVATLEAKVGDPAFYEGTTDEQQATFAALAQAREGAAALVERWGELESRAGDSR